MFLEPVVDSEILEIVKTLKSKTSNDYEGFSMNLIKDIIGVVVKPFTILCNWSLTSGIFPEKLKTAKVIPLFKSGDKHLFSNYRSVSILPQFSKILEKIFYNRLKKICRKK